MEFVPSELSTSLPLIGGRNLESIGSGFERDVFSFVAQAGLTYGVAVGGRGITGDDLAGGAASVDARIYDRLGTELFDRPGSFLVPNVNVEFTAQEDGTYFLVVGNFGPFSNGNYIGDYYADFLNTDAAKSDIDTKAVLQLNGEKRAVFEASSDSDYYQVSLEAGRLYKTEIEGIGASAARGVEIELLGSSGDESPFPGIQKSLFRGTKTELEFTAPTSGQFFIKATGTTGDYGIRISSNDPIDTQSPSPAQTIAYLYEAALNRDGNIDLPGLNFWVDQLDTGRSALSIAEFFLTSPEFTSNFGSIGALTNAALIDTLYSNILGREGEAEGVAFWRSALEDGLQSRAEVLLNFSLSPENISGSAFVMGLVETSPGEWSFG